jgi:glutathione synthase/RimK-type ligase-like ATP-grasp enzyme
MAVESVALWIPAVVLRANLDKRYLRALESQGVAIVPTVWLEPGVPTDIAALLTRHGWTDAVVKPVVSAAAHRTHRVTAASQPVVDAVVGAGAAMVQPYLAEIETAGEWSVIHLGGAYSHAVRKRPRAGDFRVQPQHGGVSTREEPPGAVRAAVEQILALVPEPLLYARVDGVESGGRFLLMELELIEPRLFFVAAPDAAPRFAAAVAALAGVR